MAVDAVAQETPRFRLMLAGRWSWLPGNVTLLVGGLIVGGIITLSLLAPWISPYDPVKPDYGAALLPPGPGHLFGTDNFGRDIFTRTIYAAESICNSDSSRLCLPGCSATRSDCSLDSSVAGWTPWS